MSPRLILEIVAGLALFGGVLWYNHHEREIGAQKVRDAIEQERSDEKERTDKLKEDTDRDWQTKVDDLQTRVDGIRNAPSAPIRLCKQQAQVRLPDAVAVINEVPEGPGPAVSSGPDISGAVLVFAAECEHDRKQVIELQDWIRSVAAK